MRILKEVKTLPEKINVAVKPNCIGIITDNTEFFQVIIKEFLV